MKRQAAKTKNVNILWGLSRALQEQGRQLRGDVPQLRHPVLVPICIDDPPTTTPPPVQGSSRQRLQHALPMPAGTGGRKSMWAEPRVVPVYSPGKHSTVGRPSTSESNNIYQDMPLNCSLHIYHGLYWSLMWGWQCTSLGPDRPVCSSQGDRERLLRLWHTMPASFSCLRKETLLTNSCPKKNHKIFNRLFWGVLDLLVQDSLSAWQAFDIRYPKSLHPLSTCLADLGGTYILHGSNHGYLTMSSLAPYRL